MGSPEKRIKRGKETNRSLEHKRAFNPTTKGKVKPEQVSCVLWMLGKYAHHILESTSMHDRRLWERTILLSWVMTWRSKVISNKKKIVTFIQIWKQNIADPMCLEYKPALTIKYSIMIDKGFGGNGSASLIKAN